MIIGVVARRFIFLIFDVGFAIVFLMVPQAGCDVLLS
jgi:hypothetical protein